jgi:xeroderma pigmentosum group C-complementing protein
VFDTLDAPPTLSRSDSKTKALLEQEDTSSDEELSSDDFEDVFAGNKAQGKQKAQDAESSDEGDWEDALGVYSSLKDEPEPVISGDISLTISSNPASSAFESNGKKGATKKQRQIRIATHCMHVQLLMWHNLLRNGWIQDKDIQQMLVIKAAPVCRAEVERYWKDSGIQDGPDRVVPGGWPKDKYLGVARWKDTVKEYRPAKNKRDARERISKSPSAEPRKSPSTPRDWGASSDRLEPNAPNLSAGDPLLRLLKYLSAYWRSRFKITAPSLRKRGYLPPSAIQAELACWEENPGDADKFGERMESKQDFREAARTYEGSGDVGQQLFTTLLRGLGIEARMVVSLQPLGFGWSQAEEGKPKKLDTPEDKAQRRGAESSKASPPSKLARSGQAADGTRYSPIVFSDDESSSLSSFVSISSDSESRAMVLKKPPKSRKVGKDLPYPTYWTEAISPLTHTPISVSPLPPRPLIASASSPEAMAKFSSRGIEASKAKQVFAYVIAFSSDGTAKDVTTRYLPKRQWPGRTKGFRLPPEKVPIYNKRGKVAKWEEFDWFKSVMRLYARRYDHRQPWDEVEDEGDLVPQDAAKLSAMDENGGKETLQGYKNSAVYVLERHLRREEALKPGAKVVRFFRTGKGDNEKKEPVYYRKDVVACKTVESWQKEGRAVKEGEQPLKYVPMRAVTVTRKREIEERQREEGGKVMQGLYAEFQTDWIIPEPIKDGKIPRNAFGNIDVYAPTMVPHGAVHIPFKGTAKICKKLGVDYAEACTGFEFGKQRAVPILEGVVVAAENESLVTDAWLADEAEKASKEQAKREMRILTTWKRFLTGLRIVERMRREYGDEAELPGVDILGETGSAEKSEWETFQNHDGDFEGGFIRDEATAPTPPGLFSEEEDSDGTPPRLFSEEEDNSGTEGGLISEEEDTDSAEGGFIREEQTNSIPDGSQRNELLTIDHGEDVFSSKLDTPTLSSNQTPISLHAALQQPTDDQGESNEDENRPEIGSEASTTATKTVAKRIDSGSSAARGSARRRSSRIREEHERVTRRFFAQGGDDDLSHREQDGRKSSRSRRRGKGKE